MIRLVIAALLCLWTTGCGRDSEPFFPSGGPSAAKNSDDFIALGVTGVAVAIVAFFLLRRGGRGVGEGSSRSRMLLAILVVSVAGTGFLSVENDWFSHGGPIWRGVRASVGVIAWGALLWMHFRSALDARRSIVVARIGALLAVVQVPVWLVAVWVELAGDWIWRLGGTLALLAGAVAHAIYLTAPKLRIGQRWLVMAPLGAAAALAGLYVVAIWTGFHTLDFGDRIMGPLFTMTITGTILVVVCRRLDPAPAEPTALTSIRGIESGS